jgi:CheY-like chemotaxis protein
MLGGTILLDSEPGVGSTFILSIPYLSEKIKAAPEKRKQPVLTDSVLKILIAEDEINNYQLLKAILRGNNITLFHAGNGYEALKICKEDPSIDLVLMDIKMPAMDGITAFKEIRKIRKYLPVIALTAYTLVQEKQQFFDLGFSEYIAKPINREELLEKINKTIMIPT